MCAPRYGLRRLLRSNQRFMLAPLTFNQLDFAAALDPRVPTTSETTQMVGILAAKPRLHSSALR